MTKYRIGDQVKIVEYGLMAWTKEKIIDGKWRVLDTPEWFDMSPERVGRIGIIIKATETQGKDGYVLWSKKDGRTAWYHNDQIKLLHRPKYIKHEN